MNKKELFTAGIFLISFLSLLLISFNAMLSARITPVKENISRLDSRIDRLETDLKSEIRAMNDKLDRLIFTILKEKSEPSKKDKRADIPPVRPRHPAHTSQ